VGTDQSIIIHSTIDMGSFEIFSLLDLAFSRCSFYSEFFALCGEARLTPDYGSKFAELVEGTWNRSARFVTHGRGRSPSCPPRIDSVLALPVCLVIRTAGSEIRPSSLA
jgi:hypothetical protein